MEFVIHKHSALPPHTQIQEQVKLALLLGRLRPGDMLPSIRDVERETGISRNIVRSAYVSLQASGILTLHHGKGVLVEKRVSYSQNGGMRTECEALASNVLTKLAKLGVSPTAFSRFLYQKARFQERATPFLLFVDATKSLAEERATKISSIWGVEVPGISMAELAETKKSDRMKIPRILTNYLRLDQVKSTVKGCKVEVIPLGLTFSEDTVREFGMLPSRASVVLVLDDADHPSLSLILESYRKLLVEPTARLAAIPLSRAGNLQRFIKTSKHHKIVFSNRVWEYVPLVLRRHPKVTRPKMEIDLASLESARIRAGVII